MTEGSTDTIAKAMKLQAKKKVVSIVKLKIEINLYKYKIQWFDRPLTEVKG